MKTFKEYQSEMDGQQATAMSRDEIMDFVKNSLDVKDIGQIIAELKGQGAEDSDILAAIVQASGMKGQGQGEHGDVGRR